MGKRKTSVKPVQPKELLSVPLRPFGSLFLSKPAWRCHPNTPEAIRRYREQLDQYREREYQEWLRQFEQFRLDQALVELMRRQEEQQRRLAKLSTKKRRRKRKQGGRPKLVTPKQIADIERRARRNEPNIRDSVYIEGGASKCTLDKYIAVARRKYRRLHRKQT